VAMRESRSFVRNAIRFTGIWVVILACAGGSVVGCVYYLDWSAKRKANEFCARIDLGSAITVVTAKASRLGILYGSDAGYTFYFPGTMFNKAICAVSVDNTGNVVSKVVEIEYD
jgi:hypothetical protein